MRRPKNSKLWMWVAGIAIQLLFCGTLLGQGGSWTSEAPLSSPVTVAASGVIGGKLFLAGGAGVSDLLSSTIAYDAATNTWEARAPMPAGRQAAVGAVVNGVLYVIGGFNDQGSALRTVEAYDPNTDTWTEKSPMTTPRWRAAAGVLDGRIYVAGGFGAYGENLTTLIAYDPKTNTWTTEAPMPTGRGGAAAAVIGGILYVAGGLRLGPGATSLRTVEAYDPRTNSWSTRTPDPLPFDSAVSGVVDGKFYVAGGENVTQGGQAPKVRNDLMAYDPGSDSWLAQPSMLTRRFAAGGGAVGDVLYVIGGQGELFSFPLFPLVNEAFSPFLPVTIRVNPATINLKSNAKIKVAILSTSMFDATSVIPDSVKLSGALADTERNGTPIFSFDDVNDDGILDLVLTFRARDLQPSTADKQVVLKGQTFAGQLVKGVATVRFLPPVPPRR